MTIDLGVPGPGGLAGTVGVLRDRQSDEALIQLHPGDVGWFWRLGAARTTAALRTWRRGGRVRAAGLLDGERLLRLATAPEARRDEEPARRMAADITAPARGVLPAGRANVEAPAGSPVQELLTGSGRPTDEPWTPLRRASAHRCPHRPCGSRWWDRNGPRCGPPRAAGLVSTGRRSPRGTGTRWRPAPPTGTPGAWPGTTTRARRWPW